MRCSADEDAALCDDRRVGRATGWIGSTWHQLSEVAVPLRYALLGGAAAGVLGGIIGLVIGLHVYAPTAWFAIFEIGLPAALFGFVLGLVVGSLTSLVRDRRRRL